LQILRGVLPPHRQDSVVGIDVDATGLEAASEGRSAPVRSGADTNGSPPEMSAQVDAPQEGAVPTEAPVPDPNAAEFDIATASIEADVPGPSVATLDPKNLTAPVSGADPSSGDPGQSPST